MPTHSTPALPPAPEQHPGFLFTCRRTADGTYHFDAPAGDVEKLYEMTPEQMSEMLSAGRLPFLGAHDNPDLWGSITLSAEHLSPWVRDVPVQGMRTGRERWVRVHCLPRREGDGAVVWTGLIIDITDVKSAETQRQDALEALARSEAWMRAALQGAKMLGWDLDLVRNKWATTADIPDFYGVPRGPDYTDPEVSLRAVHPDDLPLVLSGRKHAIETGEPMQYEFRGRVPNPDGFPRWFLTRGQVLRDAGGSPVRLLAVTTDVTDRKRAEAERESLNRQLLDAHKWESLGVLAGGVAHDFNNILTVVLGCAGLARKGLPSLSPTGMYLDQIEQASRRAADLCRQLLAYAGRGQTATTTTDLNQLVRGSTALLGVPASNSTGLRFDFTEPVPTICADPAQVRQVLVNLVINAAEALGDTAGEISIGTGVVDVHDEAVADYHLHPRPGRYARLQVSDTGPGVPPDVQARMFDPFFTTKFAGRGLGLSAVLGITRAHGGAIRVTSAPGRGTTVEVLWPVLPAPVGAPELPVPRTADRPPAKALVVDDEMYVREVTASALEEIGYEPLLVGDGASALELFRRHRGEVRVAVIDVVMPGMTGDHVLDGLRAIEPNLPAVMVSGFTDRRLTRAEDGTHTEFLQKPFHPEELIAVVKRITPAVPKP